MKILFETLKSDASSFISVKFLYTLIKMAKINLIFDDSGRSVYTNENALLIFNKTLKPFGSFLFIDVERTKYRYMKAI